MYTYRRNRKRKMSPGVIIPMAVIILIFVTGLRLGQAYTKYGEKAAAKDIFIEEEQYQLLNYSGNEKRKSINSTWELLLVNGANPLDEGYEFEKKQVTGGYYVDYRIAESLENMLEDAKAEGLSPIICSAYRSIDKQTQLFEDDIAFYMSLGYTREAAEAETVKSVAFPGTSEHNTGLAVDIVSLNYQLLNEEQEDTEESIWLRENCYKYGFILRYPRGKEDITNIIYEPWHFRYVGIDAAEEITKQGITLEEYLEDSF